MQEDCCNPVLDEEAKLKAKYPNLSHKSGGSDFLMKKLQKGVSHTLYTTEAVGSLDTCDVTEFLCLDFKSL